MLYLPIPLTSNMVPCRNHHNTKVCKSSSLLSGYLLTLFYSCTDWFFFMVLDIGTPAIESIPLGVRFIIGLLQATAVRAAGFGTVALSALAPAVKFVILSLDGLQQSDYCLFRVLYVIMMYISVCGCAYHTVF